LIVGSSNVVKPDVTIAAIVPCFLYLGAWSALDGFAYAFIGFETKGRSIEEIDRGLMERRLRPRGEALAGRAVGERPRV
jgi:putative MFS transporter